MESKLIIDEKSCTRCGKCKEICGSRIIDINDDTAFPKYGEYCIECGKCVAICPEGAIALKIYEQEELEDIVDPKITLEQLRQLVTRRRSVRHYLDKPINKKDMMKLLDIARQAPTGGNFQELEYTIISDPSILEGIRNELYNKFRLLGKFTSLLRLIQNKENVEQAKFTLGVIERMHESGEDHLLRNAPTLVIIHTNEKRPLCEYDAAIAATYINLAAEILGIGMQWLGYHIVLSGVFKKIKKLSRLPKGHKVLASFLLGYKKLEFLRSCQRKPLKINYFGYQE
ncbi:MAG: nitroreductase family protein [Candidatus Hodarchaeota archaeon]